MEIECIKKQIKAIETIKAYFEDERNDMLDRIATEIECDGLWIDYAYSYLYTVAKVDACKQEIARLKEEANKKEA